LGHRHRLAAYLLADLLEQVAADGAAEVPVEDELDGVGALATAACCRASSATASSLIWLKKNSSASVEARAEALVDDLDEHREVLREKLVS
jgi:hypothetical protein